MRVAVFSDSVAPRVDGIAVVVRQFMLGLVRQGHEVLLVGPGDGTSFPESAQPETPRRLSPDRDLLNRVQTVRLPAVRTPFDGYPLAIPRRGEASRALSAFEPDVVSIQTVGPAAFLGLSLARKNDIDAVLSWHTDFDTYTRTYPVGRALAMSAYLALKLEQHPLRRRVDGRRRAPAVARSPAGPSRTIARTLRLATDQVSAIWAPSGSAVRQIREFGIDRPVFVLPAEVSQRDLGVGTPAAVRALDRIPGRGNRPYLLYVGRLSREKNLPLLLAAFERLASVDPAALLVLVGPDQDQQTHEMLQPYLRAHPGQVVLPGLLPRDTLGEIYRRATAFITPSLSDTQCLCVSEALSLEVPVLVVDPGLAEDRPPGAVRVVEPVAARLAEAMGEELARGRCSRRLVSVGSQPAVPVPVRVGGAGGSAGYGGVGGSGGMDERPGVSIVRPRAGDGREASLPAMIRQRRPDDVVGPPREDLASRFVSATARLGSAEADGTYRWDGWRWAAEQGALPSRLPTQRRPSWLPPSQRPAQ